MRKSRFIKEFKNRVQRDEQARSEELINRYFDKIERGEVTNIEQVNFNEDGVFDRVTAIIEGKRRKDQRKKIIMKMAAAFIGFLCVSISAWMIFNLDLFDRDDSVTILTADEAVFKPGQNRALLTLADGSIIDLDSISNGEIASQNGAIISKTEDGQLIYNLSEGIRGSEVIFNSISTPRGGQFQVTLPDGSVVWLNAESTLKYPTSFAAENERVVELEGEGYFEIKRNTRKPFKVISNNQVVTVLGTKFNINSYADESKIRTTLVEGSVKLNNSVESIVLKPGEQATVSNKDRISVEQINTANAIAWKNGDFIFKSESIGSIMRKISRWYDIDVEYSGTNESANFGGIVSRSRDLSAVLKMLESTRKVRFEILVSNKNKERRIKVIL